MSAPAFTAQEEITRPRCVSCEGGPATFRIIFADGAEFTVCAACVPSGVVLTSAPATVMVKGDL